MTAKEFFKSTAFKCICVLLCIVLICGILLTICNALFFVSDKERLDRAIAKIYGTTVEYNDKEEVDEDYSSTALYKVNQVYPLLGTHEGEYLLNVTGNGGYSGGTVTCWVVANVTDGKFDGISKVTIDSNSGQSYIAKIGSDDLQALIDQQEDSSSFVSFTTNGISTGATFSLSAITNCMNGASEYVRAVYGGEVSKFANYEYKDYIEETTEITVSGTDVTYNIITKANGKAKPFTINITVNSEKKITSYEIVVNGSTSGYQSGMSAIALNMVNQTQTSLEEHVNAGGLNTGATLSNTLCVYSGLFATANYDLALEQYAEGGNA